MRSNTKIVSKTDLHEVFIETVDVLIQLYFVELLCIALY